MRAGKRAFGRAYAGWAYSAAFYRGELYKNLGFKSLDDFLARWEDDHDAYHMQDLLAMLWTWQNTTFAPEKLNAITARTIVMPCDSDMYFTVDEARMEAAFIESAELRLLSSPYGHCAGAPGRFAMETAFVESAILELLQTPPVSV
jgi:homoserine O-acetyltransferase